MGAGVAVYGTDTHGSVTVTSDGVSYDVATTRLGTAAPTSPPTAAPAPEAATGPGPEVTTCQPGQVDVNTAGVEDLERIVEVGPQLVGQMVALRPFDGLADLVRVDGIGEATMRAITKEGLACAS